VIRSLHSHIFVWKQPVNFAYRLMTQAQATAQVFWTAFNALSRKEKTAFLEKLSTDEQLLAILEDLRYSHVIDQRKGEPQFTLDEVIAERRNRKST
jgi:hypothetical protein